MIYNSLAEIPADCDLFLFDAYGVFWEGTGFYKNSRETMAELVRRGKTVVVLSNTTRLGDDSVNDYIKRGLMPGRDYNFLITSGDLLKQQLQKGDIKFKTCQNPETYYVIGLPHDKAFSGSRYRRVMNPEEADFVYAGVPYMFKADIEKYPQYADDYYPAKKNPDGSIAFWDTLTAAPFEEIVEKAVKSGKPLLNANPDFTAKEGHPLAEHKEAVFVIRNGSIAEMFRRRGAEVLEFGKPHKNIYDYAFGLLEQNGVKINKSRTCMIGDTVRTDVKGAVNAGIIPVLCTGTGVTAEEILKGNTAEKLCQSEDIDINKIVMIKSVGGF